MTGHPDFTAMRTCGGVRFPKPIEEWDREEILLQYQRLRELTWWRIKEEVIDELERIMSATLDAHEDVWSKDDQGNVIPLTERLDELKREYYETLPK